MKLALCHAGALSLLLAISACGGGGGSPSSPTISFTTAPPTSMSTGATASVAALVANDPTDPNVDWAVSCGAADCGSFDPSGTGNGDPTTYTAPASVPSPASVTITATSASDGTKVSATVIIAAPSAPVLADGTYVYHVSGQDGAGAYTATGAFTVASGRITGGEQDYSDPYGGYTDSFVPATSSLSVAGNNLQLVIDTGNPAIGVNGVETLRGTVVSSKRVLVSQFDLSATATGSIDLQTSAAAPARGYAFAVSGNDTNGNTIAIGGVLDLSSGALVPAGSVFDMSVFNPNTNTASALRGQAFQSGSVTAPDAYGRVVFTLTPTVASGVPTFALAGYVVGTDRIQLVESGAQADALNANTGGAALGQGANTGGFSSTSASVVGQSYAHGSTGMDANGTATMSGAFALNSGGALGGVLAVNDLTYVGAWSLGGSYSVDTTGRITVSVTSLSSQTAAPPATTMTFQLYLDGNGNAMVLGADPFQATQGIAFTQGDAFTLSGSYALSAQGVGAFDDGGIAWSAVGPVSVDGSGTFSGTVDYNAATLPLQSASALGGSQDATRGLLQLTGLTPGDTSATTAYGYYPLSGNRLWAIEVDKQGQSLLLLEGTTTP